MRQMADCGGDVVVLLRIKHKRDRTYGCSQSIVRINPFLRRSVRRCDDVVCVLKQVCLCICKTRFFGAGHRVTTDKSSVKPQFVSGAVNIPFYTAHISQKAAFGNDILKLGERLDIAPYGSTKKNTVALCKLQIRWGGANCVDRAG